MPVLLRDSLGEPRSTWFGILRPITWASKTLIGTGLEPIYNEVDQKEHKQGIPPPCVSPPLLSPLSSPSSRNCTSSSSSSSSELHFREKGSGNGETGNGHAGETTPEQGKRLRGADPGDARFLHDIETLSKALSLDPKSLRRRPLPPPPPPPPTAAPSPRADPASSSPPPIPSRNSRRNPRRLRLRLRPRPRPHFGSPFDPSPTSGAAATSASSPSTSTPSRASPPPSPLLPRPLLPRRPLAPRRRPRRRHPPRPALPRRRRVRGDPHMPLLDRRPRRRRLAPPRQVRAAAVHDLRRRGRRPGVDLGRHHVDLTRLLPITASELEEEEKGSGKWSTSFALSGRARGAKLNVSLGFSLLRNGDEVASGKISAILNVKTRKIDRHESLPLPLPQIRTRDRSRSVEEVKILHEVLPSSKSEVFSDESRPVEDDSKPDCGVLDRRVEPAESEPHKSEEQIEGNEDSPESKHCTSMEPIKGHLETDCVESEFSVIEQGIEITSKDQKEVEPEIVSDVVGKEEEEAEVAIELDEALEFEERSSLAAAEPVVEDLDCAFSNLSVLESEGFGSPIIEGTLSKQMNYDDIKSSYKSASMKNKSRSLDATAESVASEFLNLLGIEHSPFGMSSDSDPESPRERLWKQFEKESLASGNPLFNLEYEGEMEEPGFGEFGENFDLSSIVQEAETEFQMANQPMNNKSRAKLLEDAETEALMRQWGLDEKAFQNSPPGSRSGFGSPIDLPPEEPIELPPLGDGLGPFVRTKDGGYLRSMNPSIFRNAKSNGSLIMQVSSPIVVPAEMGSGIMEILQHLASVGIEKLSMQASKLMPLEDITGKTMQQIAWEAAPALESSERQDLLENYAPNVLSEIGFSREKK
uniref:PMI1/PMIR1-2 C-terminal domain-containing protein n=1 Tax=Ananas comosus var. bracteatus TaxID=296719 RepID=A0A6V7QTU3_ANACO